MRFESEGEGVVALLSAIAFAIMIATSSGAWYHYGYYEGKAAVLADQLHELQPKPEPAK